MADDDIQQPSPDNPADNTAQQPAAWQPPRAGDAQVAATAAPAPAAPAQPAQPASNRGKIIGAVVAAVAVIAVLAVVLTGGDDSSDKKDSDSTSEGTNSDGGSTADSGNGSTAASVASLDTVSPLVSAQGTTFDFSPDGKSLAVGGSGTISLWDVATGTQKFAVESSASSVQFSPDGQTLLAYTPGEGAQALRTSDGKQVSQVQRAGESAPDVVPVVTSRGALIAPIEGGLSVRNVRTAKEDLFIPLSSAPYGLFVSDGGGTIVVNTADGLSVFDTGSGNLQFEVPSSGSCAVEAIDFSADSKLLLGRDDCAGDLVVWNPNNGEVRSRFGDLNHSADAIMFLNDPGLVLTCGAGVDTTLCQVWAAATGEIVGTLAKPAWMPTGESGPTLLSVDLSADGLWLLVSIVSDGGAARDTVAYNMFSLAPDRAALGLDEARFNSDSSTLAGIVDGEVRMYALNALPSANP